MGVINNKCILLEIIKELREEMIKIGLSEGLDSKNTIKISRVLDSYILRYQKVNSTKY